jgi:hypothetical protein
MLQDLVSAAKIVSIDHVMEVSMAISQVLPTAALMVTVDLLGSKS